MDAVTLIKPGRGPTPYLLFFFWYPPALALSSDTQTPQVAPAKRSEQRKGPRRPDRPKRIDEYAATADKRAPRSAAIETQPWKSGQR